MKSKTQNQIDKYCMLYRKRLSLRRIAATENVSVNTIKKYLIKNGINVKTHNIVKEHKNNDALIGLYIGIWCGDGTQYYDDGYRIKICCNSNDTDIINFVQSLILRLFNKKTYVRYEERHRALIRFKSKYIYSFVENYVSFSSNKTLSIHLKHKIGRYSSKFLLGFVTGLIISDGYIKKNIIFNSVSEKLAKNYFEILKLMKFNPRLYVHLRTMPNWHNLNMIALNKKESYDCMNKINSFLLNNDFNTKIEYMKKVKGKVAPP